ncbi:MAG: L-lactate permease [Phascolarctobacterium sp.]|nr:L-lactate permease [Phascolarctobacterium sp.]
MLFFLAILPILWLIIALVKIKLPAWQATLAGTLLTLGLAAITFEQSIPIMLTAALEGMALAIWPVCAVVIGAIYAYNLVVSTKAMDKIKIILSSVSSDKRVLGLILAWGFSHFMEGMAGFGVSVAIPAAMMVAIGFNPLRSVLACLSSNCVSTCLGGVGLVITILSNMTQLDIGLLGVYVSLQMFALNIIVPFFIVSILGGGFKALKGVGIITLIAGLSLAIPEIIICNFFGPELSVIIPSLLVLLSLTYAAKIFAPNDPEYALTDIEEQEVSPREGFLAAIPFVFILIILIFTSKVFPAIYEPLASLKTSVPIYMGEGAKPYTFVWLATPGPLIFIAASLGGFVQKASIGDMCKILLNTINSLKLTILTIIFVVMTAKIMTYAGMISVIAEGIVSATGSYYPFFAPIVGGFGAFITGSGTNANVLFGTLQTAAASKISADVGLGAWLAASNAGAGGIGKMVSLQSIAIAIGSVTPAIDDYAKAHGLTSEEVEELYNSITPSSIMQASYKYMLLFFLIYCLIVYFGYDIVKKII